MNLNYYNNLGMGIVSLGSVLNQKNELPISKLFLIIPFITHQKLLQHLGRSTTKIKSIEKLIVEKTSFFSNFNKRYNDSLVLAVNSLQYLHDSGYINISNGNVTLIKTFEYDKNMGNRASRIFNASKNISLILEDSPNKLYLNLRVEL